MADERRGRDRMTQTLLSALIRHYDSVFFGPNGDYAAVMEVISGMPAAQAAWKSATTQNSIWQIVMHLATAKKWQVEMIKSGIADFPAWEEAQGDEADWQATLA